MSKTKSPEGGAAAREALRQLPSVDRVLSQDALAALAPATSHELLVASVREELAAERAAVLAGRAERVAEPQALAARAAARVRTMREGGLRSVVNATGTLLHTNLGRAKVPAEVAEVAARVAASYVDLELDLESGKRGNRYKGIARLVKALTGAEDALAVNNNAAAVLLAINTLAAGKEVIVSRGELIEIGGAFRVPEIVRAAGAKLVEVGTTNRTKASDYERAITPDTGLLLKTHTSNYRIVGFTKAPTTSELVAVGRKHGVPVYEDLGSGSLVDLTRYRLTREPTVTEVLATGVELVSYSTDKLLGGPQGGILAGRTALIRACKANNMLRALRIDKVTMAMLEKTMQIYLDPQTIERRVPFYWAVARSAGQIKEELDRFLSGLAFRSLEVRTGKSHTRIGGGACPTDRVDTHVLILSHPRHSAEKLAARLRTGTPAVLGRIHAERLQLDFRTVFPEDREPLAAALSALDAALSSA